MQNKWLNQLNKNALLVCAVAFALPSVVTAGGSLVSGGGAGELQTFLINTLAFANNVLIPFVLAIGFLIFVFGMVRYFVAGAANEQMREQGRSLAVYAVIGFVSVIIFWGVVNLLSTSIGLEGDDEATQTNALLPSIPGY